MTEQRSFSHAMNYKLNRKRREYESIKDGAGELGARSWEVLHT